MVEEAREEISVVVVLVRLEAAQTFVAVRAAILVAAACLVVLGEAAVLERWHSCSIKDWRH